MQASLLLVCSGCHPNRGGGGGRRSNEPWAFVAPAPDDGLVALHKYHHQEELEAKLERLHADHPRLTKLYDLSRRSVQNRPLLVLHVNSCKKVIIEIG